MYVRIVNNVSPSIVEISSTKRELAKRPSLVPPSNRRTDSLREKVGSGVIILIQQISDEDVRRLKLDTNDGAIVIKVMDNSPASRIDIQKDDVIIGFNGKRIKSPEDLIRMVAIIKPGSKASVTIIRDKQSQAIGIEVGKMPKDL